MKEQSCWQAEVIWLLMNAKALVALLFPWRRMKECLWFWLAATIDTDTTQIIKLNLNKLIIELNWY